MKYQDEIWWQNIEEWIFDESKPVTFEQLALANDVHVNAAKKMLFTFHKESERKTGAIYFVFGQIKDEFHAKIVFDDDTKKEESKFSKVISKHIFALYNPESKKEVSDLLLSKKQNNEDVVKLKGLRGVTCSKTSSLRKDPVDIQSQTKSEEKKVDSKLKVKEEPKVEEPNEKQTISSDTKKSPKKENDTKPKVKPTNTKTSDKKKDKGKSKSIASMFAAAPPAKKKVKEEEHEEEEEEVVKDDSPGKENKIEVEESSAEKQNTKLKAGKKRIRMMSSSDSSDDEVETKREDDGEQIAATPQAKESKRRKTKLANKTFVDENGFLVTKKEQVECSSEEDEPMPSPPKPKPIETKPASSLAAKNKQSNIKNFFFKK